MKLVLCADASTNCVTATLVSLFVLMYCDLMNGVCDKCNLESKGTNPHTIVYSPLWSCTYAKHVMRPHTWCACRTLDNQRTIWYSCDCVAITIASK